MMDRVKNWFSSDSSRGLILIGPTVWLFFAVACSTNAHDLFSGFLGTGLSRS
jgi:hypothetical protein